MLPDRKTGSFLGRYSRAVKEFFEPYAKPQDMANREDVSWVALRDESGSGVLFAGLGRMSATVLPYTADELAAAAHPTDLPRNPDRTRLDLDATVLGLGGASCGPIPIERDIVKAGAAHRFGFVIRPLGAKADAAELARVRLYGHGVASTDGLPSRSCPPESIGAPTPAKQRGMAAHSGNGGPDGLTPIADLLQAPLCLLRRDRQLEGRLVAGKARSE